MVIFWDTPIGSVGWRRPESTGERSQAVIVSIAPTSTRDLAVAKARRTLVWAGRSGGIGTVGWGCFMTDCWSPAATGGVPAGAKVRIPSTPEITELRDLPVPESRDFCLLGVRPQTPEWSTCPTPCACHRLRFPEDATDAWHGIPGTPDRLPEKPDPAGLNRKRL